jgi:ribosomal protein S12 methylthiotransferase accessory factor YcaO
MMSLVEPDALTTASGTGAAPSDVAAWTVATSLITKEQLLVPAAAVRTLTADNAERVFEATTAGTGAGSSLADAAARGLLSALAHDALVRTVRGSAAVPVDPAALADADTDAEITFLVSSLDQLGVRWELLDLGESRRSGVHVLLARAGGEWAVGSETGRGAATSAALRDLLGRIQLWREEGEGPADTGDPLLRDLAPGTLATSEEAADAASAHEPADWTRVLERLREAGRDALVVPTGSADLATVGISTVRVLLTKGVGHGA